MKPVQRIPPEPQSRWVAIVDDDPSVRSALAHKIVAQLKDRHGQLSAGHLDSIRRLAQGGEPGKRIQLPGGVDVTREKDTLLFRKR